MIETTPSKIQYFLRSGFYALTVTLGIALALNEFDIGNVSGFWLAGGIVALIFGIELTSSVTRLRFTDRQMRLPYELGGMNTNAQVLHHLLLPLNMYVAILLFGMFNSQPHLRLTILGFGLISMTVLFVNITAFYAQQSKLAQHTHYVYDLAKLLIFFGYSNALFVLGSGITPAIAVGVIAFGLMALNIYRREQFSLGSLLWVFLSASFVATVAIGFALVGRFNALQLGFISFISFYLSTGILHHRLHGDLKWQTVAEYLVVMALAAALLFGLV